MPERLRLDHVARAGDVHDIVLVGGGHAHVEVLRRFAMRPEDGIRLTLVSRDLATPYSGMVPGLVAGHYTFDECHVDLGPLSRSAGARLYHARATGIDLDERRLKCDGRPPVPFDLLSIDIGSRPALAGIAGAGHALPVKPVDNFLSRWRELETGLGARGEARLAVIGGGAAGVEVSLCLDQRLKRRGIRARIAVVTDEGTILVRHSRAVRRRMLRALHSSGIAVHVNAAVEAIAPDRIRCVSGLTLPVDVAVIATHAAAPPWLAATALAVDDAGFVRVGATLQSLSHPFVLAAGDVAAFEGRPLPKNGVYAVRQGPVLADNLRRLARGRRPRAFRPQKRTLALITTGDRNAIASYGRLSLEGPRLWRVKDRIDRRWMRRYQQPPVMAADETSMRCGGCGAKVPAGILSRVLGELAIAESADVRIGLGAADDGAVIRPPRSGSIVQSVDQFRSFIDDAWLFGRIGVVHCLGDLYAMGAEPTHAMALVTVPPLAEERLERDLRDLLAGATCELAAATVTLVGGHTGEGRELAFGLSVSGVAAGRLLTRSGLRPGDLLVLTKPVGTGIVLAAHMRALAAAAWVDAAIESMLRSNRDAARILLRHDAGGCTDITGFGLVGHLGEMLAASGLHARLRIDAVPLLPGVRALDERGIRSTLYPGNLAQGRTVVGADVDRVPAGWLFDPQTSGGLLAGVQPQRIDGVLRELRAAGGAGAVIGEVVAGAAGRITLEVEGATTPAPTVSVARAAGR